MTRGLSKNILALTMKNISNILIFAFTFHTLSYYPCPSCVLSRCGAGDQPVDENDCPFREEYSALCSIITNSSGPFQHCHFRISPQSYYSSCVYDLCAYPQTWGQDLLCSAVEAYDAACTMLELLIPNWRSDLSCCKFAVSMHSSMMQHFKYLNNRWT